MNLALYSEFLTFVAYQQSKIFTFLVAIFLPISF